MRMREHTFCLGFGMEAATEGEEGADEGDGLQGRIRMQDSAV